MSNYEPFLRSLSANTLIPTFDRYLAGYYYSFSGCAKELHLYRKAQYVAFARFGLLDRRPATSRYKLPQ